MRTRHGCEVVVVDHLHLIDAGTDESRVEQIRRISGALKSTFKRLDVGGVVLAQLNRDGDERPTLRSLREGGSLEQDADVVLMLHRDDYHRRQRGDPIRDHRLELLLQKNKDGRLADLSFYYDPARFRLLPWGDRHVYEARRHADAVRESDDIPFAT